MIEILIVFFVVFAGAFIFHYLEGLHFFDSLYFVMTTMATIWLWDITPKTDLGKVFVIIYSFLWVPLFMSVSWLILESRFNRRIKSYISRFHKELHEAETELKDMEDTVSDKLEDVLASAEQTQDQVEETQDQVEETQDQVEENTDRLEKVEKVISKTSKSKKKSK